MAGGQPVYRPAAPQAAMQPSMAHTPPVQQQRPLTEEDRRIIPKRVGLANGTLASTCTDGVSSYDRLKHEPEGWTPIFSIELFDNHMQNCYFCWLVSSTSS